MLLVSHITPLLNLSHSPHHHEATSEIQKPSGLLTSALIMTTHTSTRESRQGKRQAQFQWRTHTHTHTHTRIHNKTLPQVRKEMDDTEWCPIKDM